MTVPIPSPSTDRTGLTVIGSARSAAAVDHVTVTFGISLLRDDAGAAFRAAGETATRMLAILADSGVDSRSVRTADLTLGPQTEWRENREVLIGYLAGQRLLVELTALGQVERLLSDVALQGGEGVRIDGVEFTASDPRDALSAARAGAYADALARATELAGLAGRSLGRLVWIDERPSDRHVVTPFSARRSAAPAAAMPVATGDTAVAVTVTAHWAFAD